MPSNNKIVFILFFIFMNFVNAQESSQDKDKNGVLILLALDYEISEKYQKSAKIYTELFKNTEDVEYLSKAITQHVASKNYKNAGQLCIDNLDKFPNHNERFYRLAIMSLIQQYKLSQAKQLSKKLLADYENDINYEILGNIYYTQGKYKEALKTFEKAYLINSRQTALLSLVDILYVYLNKQEKAISYLKEYIDKYGCKSKICNKLISFYREQQNLDGMIYILKLQYKTVKNKHYSYKILKLLLNTLERKDIKLAIKFLENTKVDNTRLLLLYERAGYYKKALAMVRKIYKKTKNKELLGKVAILEFEMAEDKKSIMKHVLANFELALKTSNNPAYKNYYGYLLIDYDIDAKKGLKLVKAALKQLPKNFAFMDSVAWGHYKLKQCKQAYVVMKKVVDQIGLENKEIKLHWEKIQECNK